MATIKFFTRTDTKDKNKLVNIYVRLKVGRNVDLNCKADLLIKPGNWNNETQQARNRADIFKFEQGEISFQGRDQFNSRVNDLRHHIESELMRAYKDDITKEWLGKTIDKHWNPDKYKENLFNYIESFIKKSVTRINPRTGRPVSYKMRCEYSRTYQFLKEYTRSVSKEPDFKDIDLDFYHSFIEYLQKQKLSTNTIGKKIQTLKVFLNAAKEEGKNEYSSYKSRRFISVVEEADTIYLSDEELEKLYSYDFTSTPKYERVRDLFLIGCWTGCRFSDLQKITPESIHDGYIHLKQSKTNTSVIIPVHPAVESIMLKYDGNVPKAISNQKFNEYLKDVAELVGIDDTVSKSITRGGSRITKTYKKYDLVTTHTARRSFATNLYKAGFPTLSIMRITGHKTEKSFLKYIKVTDEEHAAKLKEFWNKNNKHLKIV